MDIWGTIVVYFYVILWNAVTALWYFRFFMMRFFFIMIMFFFIVMRLFSIMLSFFLYYDEVFLYYDEGFLYYDEVLLYYDELFLNFDEVFLYCDNLNTQTVSMSLHSPFLYRNPFFPGFLLFWFMVFWGLETSFDKSFFLYIIFQLFIVPVYLNKKMVYQLLRLTIKS